MRVHIITTTMNNPSFSFNIVSDIMTMWQYDFMRHAFEAGTIVAIVAGIVGYFIVLRRSSFAAHALSHAGFTGAAGAVLFGINPLFGLFTFTMSGAAAIAMLGRRAASRDAQIGVVLAFMLGLGVLFISLYSGYATEAYSLLFGEILGISVADVWTTLIAGIVILLVFAALYRPLLFTSLDEDVAEAKGVPVFGVGLAFMLLIAAATSIAVQVVGVLLIFSLMVTPAAVASRLARRPIQGIMISVVLALLSTWLGLFVSFYLPYPVSFFITSITFAVYILVRLIQK
ncbi:MAG TPA: metal ABC transporter permease [Candidatus Paceibacterota bacterium]|nr:metal ABC transporter permease [Candidatus Paceibacterota bacterium]